MCVIGRQSVTYIYNIYFELHPADRRLFVGKRYFPFPYSFAPSIDVQLFR